MGLAYRAICPTCNQEWIYNTRYDAENSLHHCDVCDQDVCGDCIMWEPHTLARGMHLKMLHDRMPCRDACCMCIEETELDYIAELPIEEVPLIITWQWLSSSAKDAVQARLERSEAL
jgi:hypothetical protein